MLVQPFAGLDQSQNPTADLFKQPRGDDHSEERGPDAAMPSDDPTQASAIPEEIQTALRELMRLGERESDFVRRGHFREMLESEEFWKGNQYPIWSEKEFAFRTPWDYAISQNRMEDQPTYQYVLNIYQSTGLTVIAAMAQKVPKVRFFPHSSKSEDDIATARAASDIALLVEKNNKLRLLAIREAYLLWTQGGYCTYTRFVRDKKKGIEKLPIVQNTVIKLSEDSYACQSCGQVVPADSVQTGTTGARICPNCGYALSDAEFVPGETAEVPIVSGYKEVAEGYEKMSVYGLINIKMMPMVQTFDQTGYLQLVEDVHESAVRAAYLNMHNQIGYNSQNDAHSTGSNTSEGDTYERVGRMKLFDAAAPYSGLRSAPITQYITYKRVWFRRWYLLEHPDPEMRIKLFNMFPSGVFCAFAGDKFLEARDEDLDDYWTLCTAMPSYGIYPQSIGASTVPINKQVNDAMNIVAEHLDYGSAPPVLYDAEFISGDALKNQKMRPASFMPISRSRGGMSRNISDLIWQPNIKIDSNIYSYGRSLIELVQVVSGAMPSLFGGQLRGNETASAYAQSRDQAMGKLQLFWAVVKQHHADTMRLAVECFKRNRTQDAELRILGKDQEFNARYIHIDDLRGNIVAEPEADEDFPQTWNEIRGNLAELLKSNPEIASMLFNEPANLALMKKYLGSPDIVFPAEANREKQFREIDELLQAQPIPEPDQQAMAMGAPPTPGFPVPIKFVSTIPPDLHSDDHITHIKAIMEWSTDANGGLLYKKMNPAGYANVMAHLIDHKEAMAQVQAFDMQMGAAAGPMPGGMVTPPEGQGMAGKAIAPKGGGQGGPPGGGKG